MKRGPQKREEKTLSRKGLISTIQRIFQEVNITKTERRGKTGLITIFDCLMSAFAMFHLKTQSLFAFDKAKREKTIEDNLTTLYGIKFIPCDTYMREKLDEIDPKTIRSAFAEVFKSLQRGHYLEKYRFLDGFLLSYDGTGVFDSENVSCKNCCKKEHRDGRTTYYHQILAGALVHPDIAQVIPFCPEPINKQDGSNKNDCEINAAVRFFADLKHDHPRLKFTVTGDALFASAPHINGILAQGNDYIIVAKPGNNSSLFEWINGATLRNCTITMGKNIYKFEYINKIPLNDTKAAPEVNFFKCEAIEINGTITTTKHFSWVTSHKITDNNIYELMRGGRAKWKIENETFNTLKNQGYQFEHNFGHGKKHLHTVFAFLMMLAFFIDQVQESTDGFFQAALKKMKTRRALWARIRSFFEIVRIYTWEALFEVIISESTGFIIGSNSS